ncbi:class I SAM-dependent methyltransferase [Desulfobulbus elongatus]|uniref:class I SAM-dependent methyltransferase n=1 Tax=Desulfobulbus elongatus TaxID=53332 RepID=UPI0004825D8E|nr:class I SAM-dependent methyltransferase [Desulfobulbus elongatus]
MQLISKTMMHTIDWNAAWRQARTHRKHDRGGKQHWNKRAPSFAQHARKSSYPADFIRLMTPRPEWSVLDVGCGAGTLAIPLAGLVRRVTAIDLSDTMIALLRAQCEEQGIANVRADVLGWEDDWEQAGIGEHDAAIASRSLAVDDLRLALTKLHDKARKRVYLASLVGDGPFDRRIFEAIGRDLDRGPDYIYVYNLLYQMGIHADVSFVMNGDGGRVYRDLDDAMDKFDWMIDGITPEETTSLRRYFEQHLRRTTGGWVLSHRHVVRWAIISWSK